MFDSAKAAVRQLRDPAGGPLLDQLRAARPGVGSLQDLRWGFFGHSVGAAIRKVMRPVASCFIADVDQLQPVAPGFIETAPSSPSSDLDTMSPSLCSDDATSHTYCATPATGLDCFTQDPSGRSLP